MKKKLLFVFPSMYIGGAERSLLGLLEAINTEEYDVDLFLFRQVGEMMSLIPEKINLLPEIKQYQATVGSILGAIRMGCFSIGLGRLWAKIKSMLYIRKKNINNGSGIRVEYAQRYTIRFLPQINPTIEYDIAVSFISPHYVTAQKVKAKKRIAWIHTDYSSIDVDECSQAKMWKSYDFIAAVSDQCKDSFIKKFPSLSGRVIVIENILSPQFIQAQSRQIICDDMPMSGSHNLLSIGRFCNAKNFESIPEICSKILESGLSIKWYIIGFGDGEDLIRKRIHDFAMENNVIILGKKDNPYPYIANCDVYIQPSRYEGKAVTVREAQILGKPVVITAFPTAQSQLDNGVDGIIVPNDISDCADGIIRLLRDSKMRLFLSNNTRCRDYSNIAEIDKLYSIL